MSIELDHAFLTSRSTAQSLATILDLERVVPCVEGGRVLDRQGPMSVRAEITVAMGVVTLTFAGTVDVIQHNPESHRATLSVASTEVSGQGTADAIVEFTLEDGCGSIHTSARLTGLATSLGQAVATEVLDALIGDFAEKLEGLLSAPGG
jgi:carbon monoxide dehydrogenase subunit G